MGGAIAYFTRHALGPSLCIAFSTVLSPGVQSRSFQLDSSQASPLRRASGDVGWKRFVSSCLGKNANWSDGCGDGGVGLAVRRPRRELRRP